MAITNNAALTSLSGLNDLSSLGGSIIIEYNDALLDLSALGDLSSIEGHFAITGNAALTRLHGLKELTSIGSSLIITSNDALTNIDALNSLTSIGGALRIEGNASLSACSCGIGNLLNSNGVSGTVTITGNRLGCNAEQEVLADTCGSSTYAGDLELTTQAAIEAFAYTEVTGNLRIQGTDITSLQGLSDLTSVGGNLSVRDNDLLPTLDGLGSLSSIDGDLLIMEHAALTNLDALSSLTAIRGDISVAFNPALMRLTGLSGLSSLAGDLTISYNAELPDLDGLGNLSSVGDNLEIVYNAALTNLDGLSRLTSVGSVSVSNNTALNACSCGLGLLLDTGSVSGTITLTGNQPGCNSTEEILADTCGDPTATDEPGEVPETFVLEGNYPNPFNPSTTLRFALPEAQQVRLSVHDLLGREITVLVDRRLSAGWHTATFEARSLPSGVYVARLSADRHTQQMRRMVLVK